MAKLVKSQVTKHQRGFFGRVWQIAFWLFQALMVWAIFINAEVVGSQLATDCVAISDQAQQAACEAGTFIGGGIVAVGGWFIWFIGTIVLAILMFATRGKLVTYDVQN